MEYEDRMELEEAMSIINDMFADFKVNISTDLTTSRKEAVETVVNLLQRKMEEIEKIKEIERKKEKNKSKMYYVMMRLNKDDDNTYLYGKFENKSDAESARAYVEEQRGIEVYVEEDYD